MARLFTDNAVTTLAAGISSTDTILNVAPGTGNNFPVVDGSVGEDEFVVTLEDSSGNREFVKVTHRLASSDALGNITYPCVRGYNGTTARAWSAGDIVDLRLTADVATSLSGHITQTSNAHQADTIGFDNTASGITATEVQGAIDEVEGRLDSAESSISSNTTNLSNHTSATSAHGVTSDVVGTTDNQALTNKTITAADNTLIIASSDLTDASDVAHLAGAESFTGHKTFKEVSDTVYALSGTNINPANGMIQTKTITGATTLTESLTDGQTVRLILTNAGSNITWPTITWLGGSEPSLQESGTDEVILSKIGGTLYGAAAGQAYDTVASMKAASLSEGVVVETKGYYSAGDGGGARYLVKTAAAYGGTPDEYGDHTLANGNIAVLQHGGQVHVRQFGAKGDSTTDDTSALQAALDAASGDEQHIITGGRCECLISSTLVFRKRQVTLTDIELKADSSWSAGTPDYTDLGTAATGRSASQKTNSGNPMIRIDRDETSYTGEEYDHIRLVGVKVDGANVAPGIYVYEARFVFLSNFEVSHFYNYGVAFVAKNTESRIVNGRISEYYWGEAGHSNPTLYVGAGFVQTCADIHVISLVSHYSKYPIWADGFYNTQWTSLHTYNGNALSTALPNIYIGADCHGIVCTNLYLDNGYVELRTFDNQFIGTNVVKTSASSYDVAFKLIATTASTEAIGLVIDSIRLAVNNLFEELTEGAGSWGAGRKYTICGVTRPDGTVSNLYPLFAFNTKFLFDNDKLHAEASEVEWYSYTSPQVEFKANRGLRLVADHDGNSGASEDGITFATDGTDRWEITEAGGILPINDMSYSLGYTDSRIKKVFAGSLVIADGITTPSTFAGNAQIYVDSADGDLKIKFGDGTVKTIVTDT